MREDEAYRSLPDSAARTFIDMLCIASEERGRISNDPKYLASRLGIDPRSLAIRLPIVLRSGLVVDHEDGYLMPRDWDEMQYDSDTSTVRTRRHRELQKRKLDGALSLERYQAREAQKGANGTFLSTPSETPNGTFHPELMERSDSLSLSPSVSLSPSQEEVISICVREAPQPARPLRAPAPPPRPIIPPLRSPETIELPAPEAIAWPEEHFDVSAI
jgi:hypothetical protein